MEKSISTLRKKIRKNNEYFYADLLPMDDKEKLDLINELNDMMIYWYEKCDKYREELSLYRKKRR